VRDGIHVVRVRFDASPPRRLRKSDVAVALDWGVGPLCILNLRVEAKNLKDKALFIHFLPSHGRLKIFFCHRTAEKCWLICLRCGLWSMALRFIQCAILLCRERPRFAPSSSTRTSMPVCLLAAWSYPYSVLVAQLKHRPCNHLRRYGHEEREADKNPLHQTREKCSWTSATLKCIVLLLWLCCC
jgi:hypothetical protein